jgi:O-methyltransferase
MALALARIEAGIDGSLAEVGVWTGETSVLLNAVRPDRTLHLFDTFSGFPNADISHTDTRFRDTSESLVRSKLPANAKVVTHPGYVPETLEDVRAEQFSFVLLDLDLYKPTAASLEFFYPRLSPGAYVFVHDYNNEESDWACRRAVDEFLANKPEHLVEFADIWGSVAFRRVG